MGRKRDFRPTLYLRGNVLYYLIELKIVKKLLKVGYKFPIARILRRECVEVVFKPGQIARRGRNHEVFQAL